MDEIIVPEQRNRSRSKTPFVLRSHCDGENCGEAGHVHEPVKKKPIVPTVAPIVEEPEETIDKKKPRSNRNSKTISESTTIVNNTSTPIAKNQNAITASSSSTKATTSVSATTIVTVSSSSSSSSKTAALAQTQSTNQRSQRITKNQTSSKEIQQNDINKLYEKNAAQMKTSTPLQSPTTLLQQANINLSIQNGSINDHLGYKEYSAAGEYWNMYPKTDYTYSKLSPHRREIAPGVVAMPNMSRKSLIHHHERVNEMAANNPDQEDYIRKRYQASNYEKYQKREIHENYYDSQDEVDLSEFNRSYSGSRSYSNIEYIRRKDSIIKRFFSTIVSILVTTYSSVTNIFQRSESNREHLYYTRIEEEKGIFHKICSSISGLFLAAFRYVYLFISSTLFLDSWLLKSSNAENVNKKRFLILLLLLLPFCLLGAWRLSDDTERHTFISKIPTKIPLGLPITLTALRSYTSNKFDNLFNFNFDFKWMQPSSDFYSMLWKSSPSHVNYNQITNNIKGSLTDEQYKELLNHINGYIETLVTEKTRNIKYSTISPDVSKLIGTIVQESIVHHKYQLNDIDIDRIAEKVRIRLNEDQQREKRSAHAANQEVPFVLSQINLEQISKVVKENVQQHSATLKSAQTNDSPPAAAIDVDEIIFKILSSPKMSAFVDQKFLDKSLPEKEQLSEQQNTISYLKEEIGFMKAKLADELNQNNDLKYSLNLLQVYQNDLTNLFGSYQTENNEKLEKLLGEIDLKISSLNEKQFSSIDNHIKLILLDIMGFKGEDGKSVNDVDIKNWVRNVFVAKEFLEERLAELNAKFNNNLKEELNLSGGILMKEISEKIKNEMLIVIDNNNEKLLAAASDISARSAANVEIKGNFDDKHIKKIVKEALAIYDADKTGLVDYALETAGGEILSTRCTENYHTKTAQISIFGIPLWYQTNTPRTAISPSVQPGQCWAFQGFPGFLVLKLNNFVYVTGFTLEHIPKSLAPNGIIDSAPKLFTVWGLNNESDQDPYQFGKYEYQENGTSLQYFRVQNTELQKKFNVVELRIESNHGNQNYTCLYRFRVHGAPNR